MSLAIPSCMLKKRKSVTWGTRPFPTETRPLNLFTGSQMAKVSVVVALVILFSSDRIVIVCY